VAEQDGGCEGPRQTGGAEDTDEQRAGRAARKTRMALGVVRAGAKGMSGAPAGYAQGEEDPGARNLTVARADDPEYRGHGHGRSSGRVGRLEERRLEGSMAGRSRSWAVGTTVMREPR
jgi:hypothetical protein